MNPRQDLPLVVIVGPTASGKSTLGVWLAENLGGEMVACDSTQLYRGFDIGTAKPPAEERRGIPHHLLDILDATEEATAGGYRERAIEILEELRNRECLPVFTVGTGLYLRALLEGLAEVPLRSESLRDTLRNRAAKYKSGYLHRVLRRLDPAAAKQIAQGDEQKLIRAVEVCLLTQKPLTEIYQTGRKPLKGWRAVKVGLLPARKALYERVHARTEAMLECGWLEEVKSLVESGLPADAKPFNFIGYRELRAVLKNEMQLEEARDAIQQATRRYAKRQITWFRRELGVHWLGGFGDDARIQEEALDWIRGQLAQ